MFEGKKSGSAAFSLSKKYIYSFKLLSVWFINTIYPSNLPSPPAPSPPKQHICILSYSTQPCHMLLQEAWQLIEWQLNDGQRQISSTSQTKAWMGVGQKNTTHKPLKTAKKRHYQGIKDRNIQSCNIFYSFVHRIHQKLILHALMCVLAVILKFGYPLSVHKSLKKLRLSGHVCLIDTLKKYLAKLRVDCNPLEIIVC